MYNDEFDKKVETPEYTVMLLQGYMMCFWYDATTTLQVLEQSGRSGWLFEQIFKQVSELKNDFEVKRFMLGLSSLIEPIEMPQVISDNYQTIMKVLVYLS